MMKRASLLVTDFMLFVILVITDQLTKHLAVVRLKNQAAYNLINGILEFNYLENRGAAFGVLQNQKYFFVFVALIFIGVIVFVLIKVPTQKKYYSLNIPHECQNEPPGTSLQTLPDTLTSRILKKASFQYGSLLQSRP
jgi:lipoprotein signal peptidase